jgi:hypothetical protein
LTTTPSFAAETRPITRGIRASRGRAGIDAALDADWATGTCAWTCAPIRSAGIAPAQSRKTTFMQRQEALLNKLEN